MEENEMNQGVPIWEKYGLTIEEAAQYTGVGMGKLRQISNW